MTDRPVVVVTGASRGIGAACVRAAAAAGWDVVLNYLANRAAAEATAAAARASGARVALVQGDMAREADILALFEATDRAFGRLDGVVNNAGAVLKAMPVPEIDAATLARLVALNVTGAILVVREAARRMLAAGRGGAIVNVASRASGLGGAGGLVPYAATKGAIDSLTVGAARELAAANIRVNAVSPGLIETDIHADSGMPDRLAKLAATVPMGRAGSADEVAAAVVWLMSPAASYVTGAILPVSGGR